MSTYLKLVGLYQRHGYTVRSGLYPPHFHNFSGAGGTALEKDGRKLSTGGGIGLDEVHFLDDLCVALSPKSVFIIGNAFGWSSFAFALSAGATVVALDAGVEGGDNLAGIELTNTMAQQEGLPVHCVFGRSPQDVRSTIERYLNEPPELVFIDGLHRNEQLRADFAAALDAAPRAVHLMHDVVAWRMHEAFRDISAHTRRTHFCRILWRTSSGMGIAVPNEQVARLKPILEAYTDEDEYIRKVRQRWRLPALMERMGILGNIGLAAGERIRRWMNGN